MPTNEFSQLDAVRKVGNEPFHSNRKALDFDLLQFWQWSSSDLASNTLRGRVAEFLVAQALGGADGVRSEWDAFDLRERSGVTIEVKSAAYLQTWTQNSLSGISFDIAPKKSWDAKTNTSSSIAHRAADIYVFALLAHQDKSTFDPTDVTQWLFYVLPTSVLDKKLPLQKQIVLSSLRKLQPAECAFDQLRETIERAVV